MFLSSQRWLALAVCLGCLVGCAAESFAREFGNGQAAYEIGGSSQPHSRVLQAAMQQQRWESYKPGEQPATATNDAQNGRQRSESGQALPLKPPTAKAATSNTASRNSGSQSLTTVVGSLGVVLGLFFLFVWFSKRNSPSGSAPLPREAVEVLGRVPSGTRQQMELVRLGNKLVLLSTGGGSTTPLAEVTEPNEVERLTALCRDRRGGRMSSAMHSISRASS